jgi:hypothetical protein
MISKKLLVAVATAVATFAATLTFASPASAYPPINQGWFQLRNE